jgi:hypothetical protein
LDDPLLTFKEGQEFVLSQTYPGWFQGSYNPPFSRYWGSFPGDEVTHSPPFIAKVKNE